MTDPFPAADRPAAPPVALTPLQEIRGRRLAFIHDHYRRDLRAVARLLADIRAGQARPDALPPALAGLDLTQNMAAFGAVCGRQCALLQTHHDIEEGHVFPALRTPAPPGLIAVLDRLIAEHRVIHARLDTLHGAAASLAAAPSGAALDACAAAFAALDTAIRSHFGYEETELAGALGAAPFDL